MSGVNRLELLHYGKMPELKKLFPKLESLHDGTPNLANTDETPYGHLPSTITSIIARQKYTRVSEYSRFADLKLLTFMIENEQDAPFPSNLEYLCMQPSPFPHRNNIINVSDLKLLTYIRCPIGFDTFLLPRSIETLDVGFFTNGKHLAEQCPNLKDLACDFKMSGELTVPKTIEKIYFIGLQNLSNEQENLFEKLCQIEGVIYGFKFETSIPRAYKLCSRARRVEINSWSSRPEDFPDANLMTFTITGTAMTNTYGTLTNFPSKLTHISIRLDLFDTSSLGNLPKCIEKVTITCTYSRQHPCNLLPMKRLTKLSIFTTTSNCVMGYEVMKLPESLITYDNSKAVLDLVGYPLPPKLEGLSIAIDHNFIEWDLIPRTLQWLNITFSRSITRRKYNLVDGYKWSSDGLVDLQLGRKLDSTGLFYEKPL